MGSVVRRDYPWSVLLPDQSVNRPGQIDKILNYVATEDWVVAIFGKALQTFAGLFDIGSSGYEKARPGPGLGVGMLRRQSMPIARGTTSVSHGQ